MTNVASPTLSLSEARKSHRWTRQDPRGVMRCAKCGCQSIDSEADEPCKENS